MTPVPPRPFSAGGLLQGSGVPHVRGVVHGDARVRFAAGQCDRQPQLLEEQPRPPTRAPAEEGSCAAAHLGAAARAERWRCRYRHLHDRAGADPLARKAALSRVPPLRAYAVGVPATRTSTCPFLGITHIHAPDFNYWLVAG